MVQPGTPDYLVLIGTFTRRRSRGIYVYRMDGATGALEPVSVADDDNPAFLTLGPGGDRLYAVNEVDQFQGQPAGGVSAYALDRATGRLELINRRSSGGPGPCHLTVDGQGRFVAVANYVGGSVCLLPLSADGALEEASDLVQHQGSSVNPRRQEGPHAHSANLSPDGRFLFVCDLGLDRVMAYRPEPETGRLHPHQPPWVATEPGAGPRHMDFHPDGRHAYVINELASTVTAYDYDAEGGVLRPLQTASTLPPDFSGQNTTADVHVHPSGRFLYGSNRGHDSIAVFRIDGAGRLEPAGHWPTGGRIPRNFTVDPTGTYLLAANQETDSVVVFRIDGETGGLTPTGHRAEVPEPVCLRLLAL